MADVVARNVRLFGRVQGVFYRQWSVHQARTLGITGWIRNAPDGSVEALVMGDEGAVARMVEAMRRGPSQAQVEDLIVEVAEPEEVSGFSVKH